MQAHIRVKVPGKKDHEAVKKVRVVTDATAAVLSVLDKGPDYLVDWSEINVLIIRE